MKKGAGFAGRLKSIGRQADDDGSSDLRTRATMGIWSTVALLTSLASCHITVIRDFFPKRSSTRSIHSELIMSDQQL
jgi:hypothetical protein